jgi:hypothetical protein
MTKKKNPPQILWHSSNSFNYEAWLNDFLLAEGKNGLLSLMRDHLNLEELRTLCFQLDVDYDDLLGEAKTGRIRELILLMLREDRLPELVDVLEQTRSEIAWSESVKRDALKKMYSVKNDSDENGIQV